MRRNTSLPVSAHECVASASSDADPVATAATDFATATRRLAAKATRIVVSSRNQRHALRSRAGRETALTSQEDRLKSA
jgi:hypothetical protein